MDLVAGAMVFPERVGGSEWFRKVEGKRMVALGGQGGSGYGKFSRGAATTEVAGGGEDGGFGRV